VLGFLLALSRVKIALISSMQVIDYDYLFFIVMACYIAPLMVTIVMYSIIFSAVSKMNDSRSSQTTNRGCTPTAIFPANQKLESGSDSSTSKNISRLVKTMQQSLHEHFVGLHIID